jgi:hypothetical protein
MRSGPRRCRLTRSRAAYSRLFASATDARRTLPPVHIHHVANGSQPAGRPIFMARRTVLTAVVNTGVLRLSTPRRSVRKSCENRQGSV